MPNRNRSTTIALEYPFPGERIFRYQAMQDVLSVLIDEPYSEFTAMNIVRLTAIAGPQYSSQVWCSLEEDVVDSKLDPPELMLVLAESQRVQSPRDTPSCCRQGQLRLTHPATSSAAKVSRRLVSSSGERFVSMISNLYSKSDSSCWIRSMFAFRLSKNSAEFSGSTAS